MTFFLCYLGILEQQDKLILPWLYFVPGTKANCRQIWWRICENGTPWFMGRSGTFKPHKLAPAPIHSYSTSSSLEISAPCQHSLVVKDKEMAPISSIPYLLRDWEVPTVSRLPMARLRLGLNFLLVTGYGQPFGCYLWSRNMDCGPLAEKLISWRVAATWITLKKAPILVLSR